MGFVLTPRFLIHLWTMVGLGFAMLAAQAIVAGDFEAAARFLLLVLVVDHTDGTLARRFKVREHIPRVSGETLDLITDVIGLTFVPMLFCWKAGVFLPGFGAAIAVAASMTCSLKYSMKSRILEEGYSLGAPPIFLSVLLFWLLDLPPVWATAYTIALIILCWLPIRYPITSLVTTHWKPGFASLTNYLAFVLMVPALIRLQEGPRWLYGLMLALLIFQLAVAPVLLAVGRVKPGLRRDW